MADQSRKYRMTTRAASQAATRRRITESAVALHGTLGPARTTMSAVAEHAGVRRSTLYRHFPDEAALFDACSAHWNAANPPPDAAAWSSIAEPGERLLTALEQLYDYYGRTAQMLENLLRDEQRSDVVRERFAAYHLYLAFVREELLRGRRLRGGARQRVAAAIGHAIAFGTWRSLVVDEGLTAGEAVGLMCALVAAAHRRR